MSVHFDMQKQKSFLILTITTCLVLILLACSCDSENDPKPSCNNSTDCWIVKLDETGNIQWQICLGGSLFDAANSIQQTKDGGYIVADQPYLLMAMFRVNMVN